MWLLKVASVTITIMICKSRPHGGVKKPRLVFVSDGQAIYRANALATQAKPCALDEQTGLELAVLDHAEVTRLTN